MSSSSNLNNENKSPDTASEVVKNKQNKTILIVGRSGNGKRSIGNSILGEPIFKSGIYDESILEVMVEKRNNIKVIVCPFIGDTGGDIKLTLEEIRNFTSTIFKDHVGTEGIDAIMFVLKYGSRYTKQEKDAAQRVKDIFGEKVFSEFGIIAFTYGDNYDLDNKGNSLTFDEWCLQQKGDIHNLFLEAKNRCILFNNKQKNCLNLEKFIGGDNKQKQFNVHEEGDIITEEKIVGKYHLNDFNNASLPETKKEKGEKKKKKSTFKIRFSLFANKKKHKKKTTIKD